MELLLKQIQTWLKLPKVWRFVGFASASLGLLCFAFSSSFNSLFGKWNFSKTFLYIAFSSIICIAVLFAKTWQHTRSLRFKAHMAFLVLTITSFYSSFFDQHENKKPDAYSLASCAAFAVMSLSLSRQTHCGIEVDLLYFFLGALIIQLTKIKWLLGIVGAGFSYSLIILRSYLDSQPEVNGYIGLQDQPEVIIHVGSPQLQHDASSGIAPVVTPQEGNTQDHAITEVGSHSHSQQTSENTALIKPQLLAAIKVLDENNLLLIRLLKQTLRKPFQPDHNLFIDTLPSKIMNSLNEIMKLEVAAGFEEECCHLYSHCRKEFLRQCISALKLQDFINEEGSVALTTESVRSWIRTSKIAIHILYPNERRLCDRVFFRLPSSKELSFLQICREPAIRLVNFAKTLSAEIGSPQIFMEVLKLFMTLSDIIPELESLFSGQNDLSLINEAILTHKKLGDAIRDVYKHLENLIHCDMEITDVPGGIYLITSYTAKCLGLVMEARHIIEKEYHVVGNRGTSSPLFLVEMARIIDLLESHLEKKSKNYTEPGLGYFSMMNNTIDIRKKMAELSRYASIVNEDSANLLKLISNFCNDQVRKLDAKVQQNLEDYRRSSWNEVLGLLNLDNKEEPVTSDVAAAAAESMNEKLKLFNIQFQKICNIQSKWFAHDFMRRRIITNIENILLPAYGNFIGRFQDVVGKHAYEYIEYGMFDMKAQLNHIFLGGKRMNQ